MKLHVLSDLHTEFSDFDPPDTDADVVILAGDIGVGTGGIEWTVRRYPETPVIYVPGNHEFYGHDVRDTDQLFIGAPANIKVLNDDACEIDGVRFLGSTLWTDFKLDGEGEAWFCRRKAKALLEDFTAIRNRGRLFTPEDSVELHEASRAWLVSELQKDVDGLTVVVTHHLPATQQKVLGLLFGQPDRSFFVTQIMGLAKSGRGAVQREMQRLESAGLVFVQMHGNQKHYQANRESPLFEEICGLVRKPRQDSATQSRASDQTRSSTRPRS